MTGTIRVLIADDEALVRAGFRLLVEFADGLEVVGEAATGAQAVNQARGLRPDVVLMDIRMPVMDGIEATGALLAQPHAAARPGRHHVRRRRERVRGAARGRQRFRAQGHPAGAADRGDPHRRGGRGAAGAERDPPFIAEFARAPRPGAASRDGTAALGGLTEREREVLVQAGAGRSNAEIAAALNVSAATVKTHVSPLLAKLGARDRPSSSSCATSWASSRRGPARDARPRVTRRGA